MQFSIKTLSVLALATSVIAMPAPAQNGAVVKRQWHYGNRFWQRPDATTVVTVTSYSDSEPTETPSAVYTPPAESTPTPTEAPAAAETTTSASEPEASSSGTGYIGIVSKWRSAGGLPALTQDSTLEANALKTSTDSVGGLIHELNPGTFAQVLAPGTPDNFESVYVGGWLCEIPTLPGLDGICDTLGQGWNHAGQTGHADILTSTSYSKIGCALASSTGVWACGMSIP